ncbi:hypothetical protein FACS1894203_2930 [Bacteroidia bacterium]|nr:hypothetical protein FACS1894203_2930 [Bacteroidia bacterium]GHU87405.1 hypothetical protein FACS1894155_00360 [Bacteroidia bacterium]
MIEEHVKIHDQFSLEFKIGFTVQKNPDENDFSMNMWVFIPNSLYINRYTYSKTDFYRDVQSNIRLITPIYLLRDITNPEELPFRLLEEAFIKIAGSPNRNNLADYESHIKMFQSILKSSLRNEILHIQNCQSKEDKIFLLSTYIKNCRNIAKLYRSLQKIINTPTIDKNTFEYFLFGDEFMSNLIELHTFKILKDLDSKDKESYEKEKTELLELIDYEIQYKQKKGYAVIDKDSKDKNKDVVFRLGALKKYIESQLFLKIKKREDGVVVKQFYYSVAAGISMVFATIIAFAFQIKYGNFTLPLFIALVVTYMLKDRIKELSKFYFSHKLNSKYFDNKVDMKINNDDIIGIYKESQTFVSENKIPKEATQLRNRSTILEAENRINDEKILLYRIQMSLDSKIINKSNRYPISGVNDIIRFNISQFIHKMDNAEVPIFITDDKTDYKIIPGEKVYYLNFILRFQYSDQVEYKRYLVMLNRNGIKEIKSI